jgi:fermentation-respiration switch protein FrsA (DUF1100 family)
MNMAEPNGTPAPPAPGPGARLARAAAKRVVIYGLLLMLSGVLVNIFGWADRLFFVPDRIVYEVPDKSLPYEAVSFPSRDQTKLAGWFFTAAGHAKGTVVHVHGNAANISNHFRAIVFLPPSEYNVLEFDYRGYGDSEGKPSRKGCLDDVHAAIDYVKGRKDVDPDKIVLFGQSMGGAYALVAAAERPEVKAVVAEAAFTSHRAIAAAVLRRNPVTWPFAWFLPGLALGGEYAPIDSVDRIAPRPLLLAHGTADPLIPYAMSEELYARAKEPKRLHPIPGGEHLHIPDAKADAAYESAIVAFFNEALKAPAGAPGPDRRGLERKGGGRDGGRGDGGGRKP